MNSLHRRVILRIVGGTSKIKHSMRNTFGTEILCKMRGSLQKRENTSDTFKDWRTNNYTDIYMSFEDIHKIIEILYSIPATQQLADVFSSQKHAEIELLKVKNELLSEDFEMSRIPSETSHLELFMSEKPKTKAAKSPLKSQPIHNNREKKSQPPTKTHQKPL